MNIVEPILFQAHCQPEASALCAQGIDVISYAQLAAQMSTVARRALSSGLRPGSVVALSIEEPLLHAVVILGLTQAGIVSVSVASHRPPSGLKIDAVICSKPYPFAPEAPHLHLDFNWTAPSPVPFQTLPAGTDASARPCRIILTSGTTGDPKAVALTHEIAMARNARFEYIAGSRLAVVSRMYMNMGLASALGFQFLTRILGRGGTVFFRGDSIENTLRSFELFQIQAMLATPATLAQLLSLCDRNPSIEIHFDTIISSGGLLSKTLAERVRPRLCSQLVTCYGSTESAIGAIASTHRIADIKGAAGYITPGMRYEIVDSDDNPVPPGTEGILRIASEFGVDHYIDDPVESAQAFRNGWFYPGDIGSLRPDNLLMLSGRINNVLNAGGGKMAAEKIEAIILAIKGVSEAAVFIETSKLGVEEVWAAIVCSEAVDSEGLRAHCWPSVPQAFVPAHVVRLKALPINANGKVDRSRLKEMVRDIPAT